VPDLLLGVLAIQGGFEAHARMLRGLGAEVREVRDAVDLAGLDGLVIPGGESTTISKGIESAGLGPPIRAHLEAGGTVFGTCAGMIVCEVLASYEGHPVAIREDRVLACAFHPELTDDSRLHALFMAMTTAARESVREEAET
jgi:glutamine amidotransferase PdxT